MPKWGNNSKKEEAREKEKLKKLEKKSKDQKEAEDREWQETDPQALKKLAKKREEEQKQIEKTKQDFEKKLMYQKEQEELAKIKVEKQKVSDLKTIRKPIPDLCDGLVGEVEDKLQIKQSKNYEEKEEDDISLAIDKEYGHLYKYQKEQSPNELNVDDLEEALQGLHITEKQYDLHPEKRIKKAYAMFEIENYEMYRSNNPNLNRQKIKNLMWEEFKKSNKNPMNSEYNAEWKDGKPVKK